MSSFSYLLLLTMHFLAFLSLSSSSQLDSDIPEIPTSSSFLTNTPLSPFQELSPDIAPLLPSPGGSELSPSDSAMPMIPSSPSPPNPDDTTVPRPDSALPPFGSLPVSYAVPMNGFWFLSSAGLACWTAPFLAMHFLRL